MKILCIADIHGDRKSVPKAREFAKSNGIEHIIILGDFTKSIWDTKENLADARYVFEELKDFKVMAIPGNCDSKEILGIFDEFDANLHERIKEVSGIKFIGLGGSNPTPFNTPFELTEDEIYDKLKGMIDETIDETPFVMITHFPPKDTNCDKIGDMHVGSESLRRIIEEYELKLVVCSHIHEAGGSSDRINNTKIANIGTLSEMRVGIIDQMEIELLRMG